MRTERTVNQQLGLSHTVYTVLLIVRYFVWAALATVGILIASLNANTVALNYFWGALSVPLYLLIFCSFSIGWLTGTGLNLVSHIKLNIYNRRLEKRYRSAENEVIRLKRDFVPD